MPRDKANKDGYPKSSQNDERWKQQEEFDSSGIQRDIEDQDNNESISKAANPGLTEDENKKREE